MRDEAMTNLPVVAPMDSARRDQLRHSVATFGFAAFVDAVEPAMLEALRAEARLGAGASVQAERSADGLTRSDGEPPAYRARITGLGPEARRFLTDPTVLGLLRDYFGGEHVLSEGISCLTFYDSAGHLGPHLDRPAEDCAVTIIVYLEAVSPDPSAPDTGLVLVVYGETEASIGVPRLRIPTRTGTVVLGRGSRFWHERPRLKAGESVVAITGCYRQLR